MLQQITVVLAIAATISTGYFHGVMTGRWGVSEELAAACERLEQVPARVGDWIGEDVEISARELEIGEIAGYVSRRYSHPNGKAVHVTLVCGRPGPISVHTPDVCFRGAGFRPLETPRETAHTNGRQPQRLMLCDFTRPGATTVDIRRVFWGWSADGQWLAPENPRVHHAHKPFLYKLYVLRALNRPDEPRDEGPCRDFLKLLIPELQRVLFEQA